MTERLVRLREIVRDLNPDLAIEIGPMLVFDAAIRVAETYGLEKPQPHETKDAWVNNAIEVLEALKLEP